MFLLLLITIILLLFFTATLFRGKSSLKMSEKISSHFNFNDQTKEANLIKDLFEQGQFAKASKKAREMIIKDGKNLCYHHLLGIILMSEEKFEDALKQFEIVLELMPDILSARENFIKCSYALGNFEKAIDKYEELSKIYDNYDPELMLPILADACFETNKNEKGAEFYIELLKEDSLNLNYLNRLSILFLRMDQPEKTLEIDKRILAVNNFHPEAIERSADIFYEKQEFEKSLEKWNSLEKIAPIEHEKNLLKKAQCLLQLEQISQATQIADTLLQKDAYDPQIYKLLVEINKKRSDFEKAIECAKEILGLAKTPSDEVQSKNLISDLLLELAKKNKSEEQFCLDCLLEGLKYNPENAEIYYYLAQINQKAKDFEKAASLLKKALSFEKKVKYYVMLGYIYDAQSSSILARKAFEDALRLDEKNIAAMSFLGIFYAQEKKYERAIALFSQIIENDKNNEDSYYNIALCYEYSDNKNKAYEYYKKLLQINPQHQGAKNSISVLKLNDID